MIALRDVSFQYGEKKVLDRFSLTVNDGEAVCLVGPSGCGKTTVLRLLAGLEKPRGGETVAEGKPAVVFQENRLLPWLTAAENIRLVNPAADAESWLVRLGIPDAADKPVASLSGGMRRRVAIARALAAGGDFLLLDEPFNGLDAASRENAAKWIVEVFRERPILMVSHHPEEAAGIAAKTFSMALKL